MPPLWKKKILERTAAHASAVPPGQLPASGMDFGGGVLGTIPTNGARPADGSADAEPSEARSEETLGVGLEATSEEAGNLLPAMGLATVVV